jgi:hypothetical protein
LFFSFLLHFSGSTTVTWFWRKNLYIFSTFVTLNSFFIEVLYTGNTRYLLIYYENHVTVVEPEKWRRNRVCFCQVRVEIISFLFVSD